MEGAIRVLNGLVSDGVLSGYAIGGAIGAMFYMEPVQTDDLDVYVTLDPGPGARIVRLDGVFGALRRRGCAVEGEHAIIEGVAVQFLPVHTPLTEEAYREARPVAYGALATRVMAPEHLLAIMVSVGRPKDRARIAMFWEQASVDRRRLRAILKRFGLEPKWRVIREALGL